MTANDQCKPRAACLKLSTAAIVAIALFGCESYKITDNQRATIGPKFWQDFYGESQTNNLSQQSTVVTSQPLQRNSGNYSESDSYDLSQEANVAYSDGLADQSNASPNSGLTAGTEYGTDYVSSVQSSISSVPAASGTGANQAASVATDSNIVAEVPTNVKPRIRPNQPKVETISATPARIESDSPQTETVKVAHLNVSNSRNVQENSTQLPQKQQAGSSSSEIGETPRKFRWPVSGKIITGFGPQVDGEQNDGINLAVPEGTPVRSAEDGTVIYAGNELKGYGNLLLIRHDDGWVSAYAHNKNLKVDRGDVVRRGDVIAHAGSTGSVNQPQLHFELRKGNKPVDPIAYLPAN